MRFEWQCPICYAQIGDKTHASVITCPYCGTLLVVDGNLRKFYPVKRDNGWYYYPRVDMKDYQGYVKVGDMEIFFKYSADKWKLYYGEDIYKLSQENLSCRCKTLSLRGIWGDIPIKILPDQEICVGICNEGIEIRAGKYAYYFVKI